MSGSSTSRSSFARPAFSARSRLDRLAHGGDRGRLERRVIGAAQAAVRRQLDLEALRRDAGQRLAAQRGVEHVRGDLGVERRGGQVARLVQDVCRRTRVAPRQLPHEQLLELVADERLAAG